MSAAPRQVRAITDPAARTIARFMCKVKKGESEQDCWEWLAGKDRDGYGMFQYKGRDGSEPARKEKAHRVSYDLFSGLTTAPLIRHTCDNTGCVNPGHLLPGTQADNVADRDARGRTARGETHALCTKTELFRGAQEARRRRFDFNGQSLTLHEISALSGVKLISLKSRIGRGWTIDRAVTEPAHYRGVRRR